MRKRHSPFALVTAALILTATVSTWRVRAQGSNQAGLVVRFGDGSVVTRCVEFTETELSGYDLLHRSGLSIVAGQSSGLGVTICKIEDQGCPADNCFCQCQGSTCNYWTYWHLTGETWSYSPVGASGYQVHSGDVEGWSWGQSLPPPVVPLEQICAPTPIPTPSPTDTITPTATDTPSPAITKTPTVTTADTPASTIAETPSSQPTKTPPSPTYTATPTVAPQNTAVPPSPTPTTIPERAATSLPSSATQRATSLPSESGVPGSYALFGAIMGGLLILLIVVLRRR
jgi:hypothetical protein